VIIEKGWFPKCEEGGNMLDKKTADKAKEVLGDLDKKVTLLTFTQEIECVYCAQNVELVEDIAGLSDRISREVHELEKSEEQSRKYGVDKIPAIVVTADGEDYGIRFFGIPSGYEFVSLLDAIRTVSTGNHELSEETVSKIRGIAGSAHIQVFVTPTCPYCPKSVILAHRLAYVSREVTGDMIEAIEFPHLAQKYRVAGVPRSVINEDTFIEGAVPENVFVQKVLDAVT
jgi:glutaredoxin-like protein